MHLINFFKDELVKAQARVDNLTGILAKLGKGGYEEETIASKLFEAVSGARGSKSSTRKPGRPTKVAAGAAAITKKEDAKDAKKTRVSPKVKKPRGSSAKASKAASASPSKATTKEVSSGQAPAKPLGAEAKAKAKAKASAAKKKTKAQPKPKPSGKKTVTRPALKKLVGGESISWSNFVLDTLASEATPLLWSQLADRAIVTFGIDAASTKKTKMVVAGVLTKLLNTDKKIVQQKVPGSRGKYYCLPSWFSDGGELKEEYLGRISKP